MESMYAAIKEMFVTAEEKANKNWQREFNENRFEAHADYYKQCDFYTGVKTYPDGSRGVRFDIIHWVNEIVGYKKVECYEIKQTKNTVSISLSNYEDKTPIVDNEDCLVFEQTISEFFEKLVWRMKEVSSQDELTLYDKLEILNDGEELKMREEHLAELEETLYKLSRASIFNPLRNDWIKETRADKEIAKHQLSKNEVCKATAIAHSWRRPLINNKNSSELAVVYVTGRISNRLCLKLIDTISNYLKSNGLYDITDTMKNYDF